MAHDPNDADDGIDETAILSYLEDDVLSAEKMAAVDEDTHRQPELNSAILLAIVIERLRRSLARDAAKIDKKLGHIISALDT
jgi:hypothetical protein